MTDKKDERVDRAKGAAREVIGKLLGDDAEVAHGRAKKEGRDTEAPADDDAKE